VDRASWTLFRDRNEGGNCSSHDLIDVWTDLNLTSSPADSTLKVVLLEDFGLDLSRSNDRVSLVIQYVLFCDAFLELDSNDGFGDHVESPRVTSTVVVDYLEGSVGSFVIIEPDRKPVSAVADMDHGAIDK